MTTFMIRYVFLLANLVLLVCAEAETKVEKFETLKGEVFGHRSFYDNFVEEKIHSMIELIESGEIPTEVQGDQTLEYLKSLTNDCVKDEVCNLVDDLERIKRLSERKTGAPNLDRYLRICQIRITQRCKSEIYKRAGAKLNSVDKETMKTVDALAKQSHQDLRSKIHGGMLYQENRNAPNYETVLKALKNLDPTGAKATLKKWRKREAALAKFMEKIRLSCINFLNHVDPNVELLDAKYSVQVKGYLEASNWHYYLNSCRKVVDDWKTILEDAYRNYSIYLA